MIALGLLLFACVFFCALILYLKRVYDDDLPPWLALTILAAIIVIDTPLALAPALGISFGYDMGAVEMSPAMLVPLGAFLSFIPITLIATDVAGVFSNLIVGGVYDSNMLEPAPSDFSKARAQWRQGNVTAALNAYWKAFEENPKRPAALFAAATMLEMEKRPQDAAKLYYDIARKFEKNATVWAKASLRHGRLEAGVLKHPDSARRIFESIYDRAKGTPQARSAMAELQKLASPNAPNQRA